MSLNDPRRRRKVPLPRDVPRQVPQKMALPVDDTSSGSAGGEMERRLNAALSNALDAEISNHLKGEPSELMPQEVPANAPKAGRRKSISNNDGEAEDTSHPRFRRGSGALSSRSCGNDKALPTASENELMSSLVRRLTDAERQIKVMKADLGHKTATIEDLKRKNAVLKDQASKAPSKVMVKRMELENRKLASTVREMQKFLADYGLTWVGETDAENEEQQGAPPPPPLLPQAGGAALEGAADDCEEAAPPEGPAVWLPEKSVPGSAADPAEEFAVDMKTLGARVTELNLVAGEGHCDVAKNKQGEFKLKKREYMELTFWSNGFQLDGAPLRSYSVPINRAFVQDLLDGYFPYELKEKFPDGVPFTVIDQSSEKHHRPFSQAGRGRQLGGKPKVGQSVADVTAVDAKSKARAQEVDPDVFLAKLPKNVIRNGRIVPVRAGVEDMLKGSAKEKEAGDADVVHVDGTSESKGTASLLEESTASGGDGAEKIATLQIKSTDMQRTFIMRFPYSATIACVLGHLAQQGAIPAQCEEDGVLPQYQLQTTFPKKTLDDTGVSLETAGLVPNCALLLVRSK